MAGRADTDSEDGIHEINVTPLVDVMLVLLVIFLVASVYIVKDAVELELPKAASATEAPESTISIVMDERRSLYLNGKPTNETYLAQACAAAAAKNSNTQAIIAADHRVSHGDVISVIDLVRSNGLERFALNVKKKKSAE